MQKSIKSLEDVSSKPKSIVKLHLIRTLIILFCLLLGGVAMAQDSKSDAQGDTTAEKTELEKEVEIAKQKQQLAACRRGQFSASTMYDKIYI